MCHSNLWAIFWPDMLHLTARRTALTLVNSKASDLVKKLNRLFRMSRGPFHSSKFGKQIQAARNQLLEALQEGKLEKSLIEAVLPGCARDVGRPHNSFSEHDLAATFRKKSGLFGFQHVCISSIVCCGLKGRCVRVSVF